MSNKHDGKPGERIGKFVSRRSFLTSGAAVALGASVAACSSSTSTPTSTSSQGGTETAANAITTVSTIAFVDADGPKVQAIVVKYKSALKAGAVSKETYDVFSYANLPILFDIAAANGGPTTGAAALKPYTFNQTFVAQNGTPGAAADVYVSSTPQIDPAGRGDASGQYVIIELNTDYQLAATVLTWRAGVAGGVRQKTAITLADGTSVAPSNDVQGNYRSYYYYNMAPVGDFAQADHCANVNIVFDDDLYTLDDIENYYKIFTSNTTPAYVGKAPNGKTVHYPDATNLQLVAGPAFAATHCFSEYDGKYYNVALQYSLYVPSDYSPSKKYMLVLHTEDAGGLGVDPMISLTESRGPAIYTSPDVQNLAKSQGYGGLIVVIPEIPQPGQDVANNFTGNQYLPAIWQLMDHVTSEYNIDKDRIYASGQSMGGMQSLYMAAQREDYFAGILAIASQWGNNYNKTYKYPTDGKIITNPDWENWYYSVSNNNILSINMTGDAMSTGGWQVTQKLYTGIAGVSIPYALWDPTIPTETQEAKLKSLLAAPNKLGIYWAAFSGGSHKETWIYAWRLTTAYNWLLTQTRSTVTARRQLALSGSYPHGTTGYNTPQSNGGSGGPS